MKELKKRIISLALTASLLVGASGCSSNKIERSIDENNKISYSGEITSSGLENLYIVEVDIINGTKLYLTEQSFVGGNRFTSSYNEFLIFGTDAILTNDFDGYDSSYGKVINIIPFKQFIPLYSELKDNYSAEEIISIFNTIEKDFNNLSKNDKIKKLELK